MKPKFYALLAIFVFLPNMSFAHFQLFYTPEVNLSKASNVNFKMLFWHPMENGHIMDMAEPDAVYYRHKGKVVDLKDQMKSIIYTGATNHAAAYEVTTRIRRLGDYTFVVEPAPYFEGSEGKYIQQLTKSYVNRGGVPTDWMEPVGLPVEIVPMNKPTNIITGSTFTGRVMADSEPVSGAEIEIEYMASKLDMTNNKTLPTTVSPMPGGAIVAISDQDGYFSFGIPRSGFWGFAALEIGSKTEYEGKPLSQDAVIWIKAYDLK